MMSFLSEVVKAAYESDLKEALERTPELVCRTKNFRQDALNFFKASYIEHLLSPRLKDPDEQKCLDLGNEIKTVTKKLEVTKGTKLTSDIKECFSALKFCNDHIFIVSNLYYVHRHLLVIETWIKEYYKESMDKILELENILTRINDTDFDDVIEEFLVLVSSKRNSLNLKLEKDFLRNFILRHEGKTIFKIVKPHSDFKETVTRMLSFLVDNNELLQNFANLISKNLFEPLIKNNASIDIFEDKEFNVVEINERYDNFLSYSELYSNILSVLKFLEEHLNIPEINKCTVFTNIIGHLLDNVSILVIEYLRVNSARDVNKGLIKLEDLHKDTEIFEKSMEQYKKMQHKNHDLLDLVSHIQIVNVQGPFQKYSKDLKEIMEQNLLIIGKVGFTFERKKHFCEVSRSTLKFVSYLKEMHLNENEADKNEAIRYMKYAITTYSIYVPEYHKKMFSRFPKVVALFHNNCFYISEKVADFRFGEEEKSLWTDKDVAEITEDLHRLELTGAEHFTSSVEKHIKEVENILTIEDNIQQKQEIAENYLPLAIKNRMEKCFEHIENLKSDWINILPLIVFKRGIGQIMNAFYTNLLMILAQNWKEYSPVSNEHLKNILDSGESFCKYLFDQQELVQFIPIWRKIEAVTCMLSSSLTETEKEFSNGTGVLSLLFEPLELKQWLKIMFPHCAISNDVFNKIID